MRASGKIDNIANIQWVPHMSHRGYELCLLCVCGISQCDPRYSVGKIEGKHIVATAAKEDLANNAPQELFIHEALKQAQINALRVALYQQTHNHELAAMKVETYERPGMPFLTYVVAREHHDRVRELANEYLTTGPHKLARAPSYEETLDLMDMFQGGTLDRSISDYGVEELAFEEFSRDA